MDFVKNIVKSLTRPSNVSLESTQEQFLKAVYKNDIIEAQNFIINKENEIEINGLDQRGLCAIHICAIADYRMLIQVLLSLGADIEKSDRNGWTCLHAAVAFGNIKMVKLLLRKGASHNLETNTGETPMTLTNSAEIKTVLRRYTPTKRGPML